MANASGSVPVPLQVGSWPSNVPPFGYENMKFSTFSFLKFCYWFIKLMGFFFLFIFSSYMGHVPPLPAVLPIDASSSGSSKAIQVHLLVYLATVPLLFQSDFGLWGSRI